MALNDWQEQFDKKFVQEGVSGQYVQITMYSSSEVKTFIQSLLDQQKKHYETLFENEHLGAQADTEEALKAQKAELLEKVDDFVRSDSDWAHPDILRYLRVLKGNATPIEGKDENPQKE